MRGAGEDVIGKLVAKCIDIEVAVGRLVAIGVYIHRLARTDMGGWRLDGVAAGSGNIGATGCCGPAGEDVGFLAVGVIHPQPRRDITRWRMRQGKELG